MHYPPHRCFSILASLGLALAGPAALRAANVTWTGGSPSTGNWSDAANWNPGVPTFNDALLFGQSNRTATTVDVGLTFNSLTFDANAPAYTTSIPAPTQGAVFLGFNGAGILNLSGQTQTFQNSGGGGNTGFINSASAGNVTFLNYGGATSGAGGGYTSFNNNASAGSAIVTNYGSALSGAGGGNTNFQGASTASSATLTNSGGVVSGENGGHTQFVNTSTAGSATITNNGASVSGAFGGYTAIGSSAGNALITNNGGTVSGASGGYTFFAGSATASNSTLITNGGTASGAGGGTTFFDNTSAGGTARAITNAGGTFDISGLSSTGMGIGSIEGAGAYVLGAKNLRVGGNNLSTSVTGIISGTGGSLTKEGTGMLNLAGANTDTGGTTVNGGVLRANNTSGSATGSGAVTVNNGGTLGGGGTIAGNVTINAGGTLSPGNSPGRLTLGGSLALASGSVLFLELGGTLAGSGYDQVLVAGALTLGGNLAVSTVNGFTLAMGETFYVLDRTGSDVTPAGIFANAPVVYVDPAGNTYAVNYAASDPANGDGLPNDISLTVTGVVPEPSTWALLLAGGGALVWRFRRRSAGALRAASLCHQ